MHPVITIVLVLPSIVAITWAICLTVAEYRRYVQPRS